MPKQVGVDKWMFFTTALLIVAGLVMVFSASAVVAQERYHSPYTFVGKQAGWALAGLLMMVILMNVDCSRYNTPRFIYPALAVTTLLLVSVYFFPGSHNTHRWIRFGGFFTFQPSEIAKPVLILFLAWFLHSRLDQMNDFKRTLLRAVIMPAVFILLIVRQPDLGTALVLAGITAMMLILAGMKWRYFFGAFAAVLPFLGALLFFVPWRWQRILVFLNPDSDPQGHRLPHQPVADCRGHRRVDRARLHGGRAKALLSARSAHRLYLRQYRRGTWILRRDDHHPAFCGAGSTRHEGGFSLPGLLCAADGLRYHHWTFSCRRFSTSAWCWRCCPPRGFRCR